MIVQNSYDLGRVIIAEKKRQGISTKALSAKAGVSHTTINDILYRPECTPGLRVALPILKALGLELVVVRRKKETCTDSCPIEGRDAD